MGSLPSLLESPLALAAGLGAACRRPMPAYESPCAHHSRRPTPRNSVAVASLREVSALRAVGVRRAGNPLGRRHIKRQATAVCALYRLRPQGRDYPASWVGGRAYRFHAIPKHRLAVVGMREALKRLDIGSLSRSIIGRPYFATYPRRIGERIGGAVLIFS